jgi:hypothetical protein
LFATIVQPGKQWLTEGNEGLSARTVRALAVLFNSVPSVRSVVNPGLCSLLRLVRGKTFASPKSVLTAEGTEKYGGKGAFVLFC